jgi:putative transposase
MLNSARHATYIRGAICQEANEARMARRQRLPLDAYTIDGSAWHVTTTVARQNGTPFVNTELGLETLRVFVDQVLAQDAVPHLVCVMPDHLHLLVEVRSVGLVDLIGRLKSTSTRTWWTSGGKGSLWQTSSYDHGIREPGDFEATITYILNNPVEAGLAEKWEAYPLIGGTLIRDSG